MSLRGTFWCGPRLPVGASLILSTTAMPSTIAGALRSRDTDLMIADVSSVTLDHLYLRPSAPIALCDRRSNRSQLLDDPGGRGDDLLRFR